MIRLTNCLTMLALLVLVACASDTSGGNQLVSVSTFCGGKAVNGASCVLRNKKGEWQVTTPGSIKIWKAFSDLSVTCEKGDVKGVENFVSRDNVGLAGALGIGFISYAIDSAGAKNYPDELEIALEKPCP